METPKRPLLNERQTAEWLNVPQRTLQDWRQRGKGPKYIKIGGAVRYDADYLEDFIDMMTRQCVSDEIPAIAP